MQNEDLNLGWAVHPDHSAVDVYNLRVDNKIDRIRKFFDVKLNDETLYDYYKKEGVTVIDGLDYHDGDFITITKKADVKRIIENQDLTNNVWNAILLHYMQQFAPEHYKLKQNKENSDISLFYLEPTKVKLFHLEINGKAAPFDDNFIKPTPEEENGGVLNIANVKAIVEKFKTPEFQGQYASEVNYADSLKNNVIFNSADYHVYQVTENIWLDEKWDIYHVDRDKTTIETKPLLFAACREIPDHLALNRNAELLIVKNGTINDKEITYVLATVRQVLNDKLPAWKTLTTQTVESPPAKWNTLSCKIAGKVYYLHDFNTDFPDFHLEFSYDKRRKYRTKLTKAPDDYENFVTDDLILLVSRTLQKTLGQEINTLSDDAEANFVWGYLEEFALVYCFVYHRNASEDELKQVITYLFNNVKQRWTTSKKLTL